MNIEDFEIELNRLEQKIESLIATNRQLREENHQLKALYEEIKPLPKNQWIGKTVIAKNWIESMISRLKSIGHES